MNIQLSNTEEFIDQKSTGGLGQVLIRYVGLRGDIIALIACDSRLDGDRSGFKLKGDRLLDLKHC
jgi:hypothetical protein